MVSSHARKREQTPSACQPAEDRFAHLQEIVTPPASAFSMTPRPLLTEHT